MPCKTYAVGLLCALSWAASAFAGGGCLEIRQGYFWDPVKQEYFIPRGIAYQLWNPPVGANQSFDQLHYDLVEFKKMYANSVRCEIVWGEVQTAPGDQGYDWRKPDYLVCEAERLGLKLFILIGFQYPPQWFPKEWRGINSSGLTPDVMRCLATNAPSTALGCLSPSAQDCLLTNLPPDELSKVLTCLVTGAQAGAVSNVLSCLETNVRSDLLPKVMSCLISDVINYEHPQAREAYAKHIAAVTGRYKSSQAIGGWILGNEYAYFDLWEDPNVYLTHRFIGFDTYSQASYRQYLSLNYGGNIAALNARWGGTDYANFDAVVMAPQYPDDRVNPGYHDLIQWRKQSIGDFVALGAVAARDADPNHLKTYSMVGGIFNGRDANNACEDARTIVARCAAAGARLDFWAINNYANAAIGSELRSADFGIGKYQEESGLPVMISETGHSSTEDLFDFPDAGKRQAKAAPGQIWESLVSGAIGTHLFHWNDRGQFVRGYFLRERGFGIVEQTRKIKEPVYTNVLEMFRRMQNLRIEKLLAGSVNPPPDVQIFWSTNADMGWPRANQENAMMWGALKRLGYQPGILADQAFESGAYTNAPVLLLSRCYQMSPQHLELIANQVIPSGIHVHVNADFPGQFDAYHRPNALWAAHMNSLFGLDVTQAQAAFDGIVTNDDYQPLVFTGIRSLSPLAANYANRVRTWKIWQNIGVTSGTLIVTDTGYGQTNPGTPALVIKTNAAGQGRSAINTFALGDTFLDKGVPPVPLWDFRSDWLRAIYRTHFGVMPAIDLSGPGAQYVIPDYRICSNGSVLVSLLNEHTNVASVTLRAPRLIAGMKVENLTQGGIVETNSDGVLGLNLAGDDYVLLYAYPSANGRDESLVNSSPHKLWLESAPTAVWPRGFGYDVTVGYDALESGLDLYVSFERAGSPNKTYGQSTTQVITTGRGSQTLSVPIPDADLNDPEYVSTPGGGEYVFHAWLERDGMHLSDAYLPVRLLWGVRPQFLPPVVSPGSNYTIPVSWEEIPSYAPGDPTPLDRARLWDSLSATQHYNLVLELIGGTGQIVASSTNVTAEGSGTNQFVIAVPPGAQGPFSWLALLQTAPQTKSLDVYDGFEGRELGSDRSPMYPWFSYFYPDPGVFYPNPSGVTKLGEGILYEPGRSTNQVAYLVVSNAPAPGVLSGFGIVRGTNAWALPADARLWSNYVFSCDFKETHGRDCILQLQIKDAVGNFKESVRPYLPGQDQWDTTTQSLDRFTLPYPGAPFDSEHVHEFVVNVQMRQTNVTYEAYFDNIRFMGPPDLKDTFEDRPVGADFSRIYPWQAYGYDQTDPDHVLLEKGVQPQGNDGSQSAFVVAWNRTNSGNFAGFGMFRVFESKWALPADTSQWRNYSFGFDFKEASGRPCVLELQLKNQNDPSCSADGQRGINFTTNYNPNITNRDGWDTISTTLDHFLQPGYFCTFDSNKVFALVVNVQMLDKSPDENVVYVGSFDNIRFSGPETLSEGESTTAIYTSTNDFFGFKSIVSNGAGKVVLTWSGGGTLEEANALGETWTKVTNATSPRILDLSTENRFYRLRQ
jgi:hypothetical protein